ncbi:M24 family metallopeptidase [Eubacterium pyruvativorans]|uniref:M24 family metallopeptidase n=1 Tax=Eubacterium pyruvativorans TaxID=155865 RepID=UPI0013CFC79B|nr:Xaa-Pro peptidase family protein [Eubacterium pyruvativorans]MDY4049885.1 Xaa-Pro peptidase family protein [Eubacterium pyruvativorans]
MQTNEPKILAYMQEHKLDAFFVSSPTNIRYISGFTASDGAQWLLFTKNGKKFFITDLRYTEDAALECPDYEVVIWRLPGKVVANSVQDLLKKENCKNVGFEADDFSYEFFLDFDKFVEAEKVPTYSVISDMRIVKNAEEIAYQRQACEISCRALEMLLPEIQPGVTEKELAAKLSLYMVMNGADTMPYGNILISGARTSLLHGVPSEKAVAYGDFVLMDFGCQVHGYMSDMTRTVVVGKATSEQREVYDLVQKMFDACNKITKAGTVGHDIYQAQMDVLEGTKYKGYEYNNIGHGIGLFVHEGPFNSVTDYTPFPVGHVRTIEPGLYIPGWGGVRIEDQILITEDGFENMTEDFTHDLIEL